MHRRSLFPAMQISRGLSQNPIHGSGGLGKLKGVWKRVTKMIGGSEKVTCSPAFL